MDAVTAGSFVIWGGNLTLYQLPGISFKNIPGIFNVDINVPESVRIELLDTLRNIRHGCDVLGLDIAGQKTNRVIERLETGNLTFRQLDTEFGEIYERLVDQLNRRLFLAIDNKHATYYNDFVRDWAVVIDQFPSTARDIEEASKCFAFDRYTATMFHLMRVMESGLRALGASLRIPSLDPKMNPTWDAILRKCDDELKKKWSDKSQEWREDEPFFSGATAMLRAVKVAWRNPTMHVEIAYTEEIAGEVFLSVQSFMRHLGTKLHET